MTAKDRRDKLSAILHDILQSDQVYYEPLESVEMTYPAIVYSRAKVDTTKADNLNYRIFDRYEVTFIHKDTDNPLFDKFLDVPLCSHNRTFKTQDLYHDVFTIFVQ